jgi:hypothetical protein
MPRQTEKVAACKELSRRTLSILDGKRRSPIKNALLSCEFGEQHHTGEKEININTFAHASQSVRARFNIALVCREPGACAPHFGSNWSPVGIEGAVLRERLLETSYPCKQLKKQSLPHGASS